MRLTRRGKVVVAVVVVAVVSGLAYGPRSLNAAVVPALVALAAAYLQLRWASPPVAVRVVPPDDHAGRTHPVGLRFGDRDGTTSAANAELDRPFRGIVREHVEGGVTADRLVFETVVGATPITYDLTYDQRGRHRLGPADVTARDVLGLLETDLSTSETAEVLVYPEVHAIAGWARRDLRALHESGVHEERREFDRLREYDRGDSLRDIHWKSTAKRDDLIVKEFSAEAETEAVSIAVGSSAAPGAADGMAEATASLALALVEDGVPVDVRLPDGTLSVGPERGSQIRMLERLAVIGPGRAATDEADLTVYGEADRIRISVGGEEFAFSEFRSDAPVTYGVSRPTARAERDTGDAEVAA